MATLRQMISGDKLVVCPVVFNPISAKLAEKAGFEALYLGGGAIGYYKCVTEANLTMTEMCQAGLEVRTVTRLPLILDGACGWGDPMHMHRTIQMAEAAGFAGIEIEDQTLPKRVSHHVGSEKIIPMQLMVDKIKEAVAARTNPDFVIIGRTNAARTDNIDEAVRRGEAYKKAGADMLFCFTTKVEEQRKLGERLPAPLLNMVGPGVGIENAGMTIPEMEKLGYRILVDPLSPLMAMHHVLKQSYDAMTRNKADPTIGGKGFAEMEAVHETIDLDKLVEIERRTVGI